MSVQSMKIDNFDFEANVIIPKQGWNGVPELNVDQACGVAVGYVLAALRKDLAMGDLTVVTEDLGARFSVDISGQL